MSARARQGRAASAAAATGVTANPIAWLVLRRMRTPLLVVVCAYAVSVLGLTLVPGIGADGMPVRVDFLHALYIVSYTATTIGFGELPNSFTEAQRLWVMVCIYLTVPAWLYTIGAILVLLRDPTLRQTFVEYRFTRSVARLGQPFYLLCGYGESGKELVQSLNDFYVPVTVIDIDPLRLNELTLNDQRYRVFVPGLCGDASEARNLLLAGLHDPLCRRVIANTGDDRANLKIAITSKLLNPRLPVIARTEHQEIAANMESFGTEQVLDPYRIFSDTLALAWRAPAAYCLQDWLLGTPQLPYHDVGAPPRGIWILCGYGRFGRRLSARLESMGMHTVVIEKAPDIADPPARLVHGTGTEEATLREAGCDRAAGIVAGTDDDVNNLSIIMTARTINRRLFVVARQNQASNRDLFQALGADLTMNPRQVLATRIRALLTAPMLHEFLARVAEREDAWTARLLHGLRETVGGDRVPDVWAVHLSEQGAPAATWILGEARLPLCLTDLMRDPFAPARMLPCRALMLATRAGQLLDPAANTALGAGDRVLFCGRRPAYTRMRITLKNREVLYRTLTGRHLPRGALARLLRGPLPGATR